MPDNLFQRAKTVGLLYITQWLPNGKREGNEWSAINPTRADSTTGSFKVNMITGKWMDGATGDKGGDTVSLYAYLNESKLSFAVQSKKYKNFNSGLQVEAAKEILLNYDNLYFPSENDDFTPTKSKGDYWEGFSQANMAKGETPPDQDLKWFEKNWGKFVTHWDFYFKGKFVFRVARFIADDGKKSDRPFTVWTNGTVKKFRAKRPEGKFPLWNVDELEKQQNQPVILWEGQKDAEIGRGCIKNRVSVGWYQGAGNTDQTEWEPLRGREVWFVFDADLSGRKSIGKIKKVAKEFDIILHLVYPPVNVEKGYSLADSLADNKLSDEEIEKIFSQAIKKEPEKFLDDNPFEFKILGYSGEYITFYPFGSKKVVKHKATSLGKPTLITLMDRELWGEYYAKMEGGIAWDTATNDILRAAERAPVFDPSIVRGSGAWMDNGKLVLNTGEKLIVDGVYRELHDSPGTFIYERGLPMPYTTKDPANLQDLKNISSLISKFNWKDKIYSTLLKGWILLAPFGGALRWRSHVWLTGRKGSGKSWILENILYKLLGENFGVMGFGTSTPAGVRNALCNTSKCTIMDEMESDNMKYAEYIDQILKAFREGSSGKGHGAATLHGTSDGEGQRWVVQSMACFSSIGAAIKHGADKSRFTILALDIEKNKKTRDKIFAEICEEALIITPYLGRAIVSRTLLKFDSVLKSIDIIINQMTNLVKNRREADQLGSLLAGAWMFENDEPPTAATAKEWLESLDLEILQKTSNDKSDEESCLAEILNGRIELTDGSVRSRVSISAVLEYWYHKNKTMTELNIVDLPVKDLNIIRHELCQVGIKPMSKNGEVTIRFAADHPSIKKILKESPWAYIYDEMLSRLDIFIHKKGPDRFAGVPSMFVELRADKLFDDIPF